MGTAAQCCYWHWSNRVTFNLGLRWDKNQGANGQGADVSKWTEKATQITFSPLPLTTMQYTNKPSGIHQVMAFGQ